MTKGFLTKLMRHSMLLATVLSMGWFATPSKALLCSTVSTPTPVSPLELAPADCDGTDPGTLEAKVTSNWTLDSGRASGTLTSAVFMESGGTLDFYYQITNNTTCPIPTGGVCDNIERNTDIDFSSVAAFVGTAFRTDCPGAGCAPFVSGTDAPFQSDQTTSGSVGFNFANSPFGTTVLAPGETSNVLIITTNATLFTNGRASVIDGGVASVAAFQPLTVPEPMSFMLLGSALLGLGLLRRRSQKA